MALSGLMKIYGYFSCSMMFIFLTRGIAMLFTAMKKTFFLTLPVAVCLVLLGCDHNGSDSNNDTTPAPASDSPQISGVPAPKYLSIPNYKTCTDTQSMGTWNALCLPIDKPSGCHEDTWQALQDTHELETCHSS